MFNANNPYNQSNFNNVYPQPGLSTPNSQYTPSNQKKRTSCLGCFIALLVIFGMLIFTCIFSGILGTIQSHPPSIFFQRDFPLGNMGLVILMGAASLLFVVAILVARSRRRKSKRIVAVGVPFFLVAGCIVLFWSFFINPNIGMSRTGFIRSDTVSITVGDAIYFRDSTNGVMQILCVGENQHCQPGNNDPSQLKNGLAVQPGQTVRVIFGTEGTYQITSKTTPHMNIMISVNVPSDDTP